LINCFYDLWICSGNIRDQVESCKKLRHILNVFSPSQILGGRPRPSKNCTHVITPASQHVVWINICHDTPINSKVIDAHMLNFKPNFKFSALNIWGDPRPLWVVCWQALVNLLRVKKFEGVTTPKVGNSLPKNVHFGGSVCTSITFLFVYQSSPTFFAQHGMGCS